MQKTFQLKGKDIKRSWHLVDAKDQVLGRMATGIATLLTGKNKVDYTPHQDMGDIVVVVNAKDVKLTGKKLTQKVYYSHSGYPGGFKEVKAEKLMEERPSEIIRKAVFGMLPDNRLKKFRMTRLKIFNDSKHPHEKVFESGGRSDKKQSNTKQENL